MGGNLQLGLPAWTHPGWEVLLLLLGQAGLKLGQDYTAADCPGITELQQKITGVRQVGAGSGETSWWGEQGVVGRCGVVAFSGDRQDRGYRHGRDRIRHKMTKGRGAREGGLTPHLLLLTSLPQQGVCKLKETY